MVNSKACSWQSFFPSPDLCSLSVKQGAHLSTFNGAAWRERSDLKLLKLWESFFVRQRMCQAGAEIDLAVQK